MKHNLVIVLLFLGFSVFGQEKNSKKTIELLKQKISQYQGGEKLEWMDSLSNFIVREAGYNSDSIVQQTVNYALELDSLRIATWHTANLIYYQNNIIGNPKEANAIFINFFNKAESCSNHKALAKFYLEGADSYFFLEDYKNSLEYYDLSIAESTLVNDAMFVGLAKLYKGGTLSYLGEFAEASNVLQEAAVMFQKVKDTFHIIGAKNSLSVLYSQNAFFIEAKKERDEAIFLAKLIDSQGHLSSFYYNAATDDRKQGIEGDRIINLNLALEASKKTFNPDFYEAIMLSAMVVAYAEMDSIPKAEKYLKEMELAPEQNTTGRNTESYLEALKSLAFAKKNYFEALRYGKEHLSLQRTGMRYEEIQGAEKFLSEVYEAIGNKEKAFLHFKKYVSIKDSITNVQKIRSLSYYQTLYETEKRDLIITANNNEIALLEVRNKVKNQLLLFGGVGLFGFFGFVILYRSRAFAKRKQHLQEEFSQDLIHAQEAERTRVARELHDSVGQKLMLLTKQTKATGNTDMESLAVNTLAELRYISRGLYPANLESIGFTAAIKSMINEVDANTNIFFTNDIENIDILLSKETALHLYRILQEILNNMVKHSEAKSASIIIERKMNTIQAIVEDNGIGFDYSEKIMGTSSLGMKTLLERAKIIKSTFDIRSKTNHGTTIELIIQI